MSVHLSRKTMELIFILTGIAFLLIGVVGIFLPLLPTTPFLLLSAYCFNRGSEKFHHWLINHKYLGPPILDWEKNHVIRRKSKILAMLMIVFTSGYVFLKDTIPSIGKIAYGFIIILVLVFIWTRPDHH